MAITLLMDVTIFVSKIYFYSFFLNTKKPGIYRQLLYKNTDVVNGCKQPNANVTLYIFLLYPIQHACHSKLPLLFAGQACAPTFSPRHLYQDIDTRVVSLSLSGSGIFVLCAISWRVIRYAYTGFILFDIVPTLRASRQGFDLACRQRPSDVPWTGNSTRVSEAQYG